MPPDSWTTASPDSRPQHVPYALHADTTAVAGYARAQSRHGADCAALAAGLAGALGPDWAAALGPAGSEFAAALTAAVENEARAAAELGRGIAGAAGSTDHTAARFAAAEAAGARRVGAVLGGGGDLAR